MNATQLDLLNRFNESDAPENASGETAERQVAKKTNDNSHVTRGKRAFLISISTMPRLPAVVDAV
jgi:hypothetical protein